MYGEGYMQSGKNKYVLKRFKNILNKMFELARDFSRELGNFVCKFSSFATTARKRRWNDVVWEWVSSRQESYVRSCELGRMIEFLNALELSPVRVSS